MLKLRQLRCSFCRKSEDEVQKLVAGPRVYICDVCAVIANQLMDDSTNDKASIVEQTFWRKLLTRIQLGLRRNAHRVTSPGF